MFRLAEPGQATQPRSRRRTPHEIPPASCRCARSTKMKRIRPTARTYFSICAASLFLLSLTLGGALRPSKAHAPSDARPGGARQAEEKVVKKSSHRDEPIKIVKVKNKKGELPLGKKFRSYDAEWLRGLTITVRNDSGKDITHIRSEERRVGKECRS